MSMKKCSECGNIVSSKAQSCPSCGAVLKKRVGFFGGCLRLLGIGFTALILIVIFSPSKPTNKSNGFLTPKAPDATGGFSRAQTKETITPKAPDTIGAFVMSKEFVKKNLKAPATAKFPRFDKSFVQVLGDKRYKVSAYVDAQNSFGALIRNKYICVLKDKGEDVWSLETIDIQEQ